jgi:hypothetical protein
MAVSKRSTGVVARLLLTHSHLRQRRLHAPARHRHSAQAVDEPVIAAL